MKKATTIIYIVYEAALAVGLRAISGARAWSPLIWEYYIVYGTHWLLTPLAMVALALWAGTRGTKTLKTMLAVVMPVQTLVLAWSLAALLLGGVGRPMLPLLAMSAVTADFFVLTAMVAGVRGLVNS